MQSLLLVVFIGVLCGGVLSLLSPLSSMINQRLGVFESVLLVHLSGTVAGVAALLVFRQGLGNLDRWSEIPWYLWISGVLGLFVISSYTYLIPRIGVAVSVLITVTAQLAVSAFLDHFGFLGAAVRPITILRGAGIAVMFLGVWLTVREPNGGEAEKSVAQLSDKETGKLRTWLLVLLVGVVGGAAMGLQSPMYSMINQQLGVLESVVIVHITGSAAALLTLFVFRKGIGNLGKWRTLPWYLLAAGMLGVVVISSYTFMIPRLGVTASVLITVTTQMAFSSVWDHYGFLGAAVRRMNFQRLAGIAVMFLGVWVTVR